MNKWLTHIFGEKIVEKGKNIYIYIKHNEKLALN